MTSAPYRLILLLFAATPAATAAPQPGEFEFFEKRIRPVLSEHCYRCHNSSGTDKGGLTLDHRAGLLRGGRSGPAIVPGDASHSLLVQLIRHQDDQRRMPAEGAQLPYPVINDFVQWIDAGAVDPRDAPPTASQLASLVSWEEQRKRRMRWWSWQPVARPSVPKSTGKPWSDHPIDRFVLAKLEEAKLRPARRADRRAIIRRITFALTGLPPTPREIATFLEDGSPRAYENVVERLLDSPRFGERWARHWMDWMRYADSHGSEGDPAIPHAWRYRDYLIRALNEDVPFNQMIREHVAGDLLENPRIDHELGINESMIGTSQYRMVQHGFAPTDALEEQVRFIDNQIDVLTKAFLGLTVSCARCHDHKFDAISQSDYYALYGCLANGRPALLAIDKPGRLGAHDATLETAKARIQEGLAAAWTEAVTDLPASLPGALEKGDDDEKSPLHAYARVQDAGVQAFSQTWKGLVTAWTRSRERIPAQRARNRKTGWSLAGKDYAHWFPYGAGLRKDPSLPGAFHVTPGGDRIVEDVLPGGVYSHLLSSKHNAVLTSPRFAFDMKSIYVRVMGDGGAKARYVVQGYPRGGTVYPSHTLRGGDARWVRWDTTYWKGDHGYFEISTAADQPVEANQRATRSWFGITDLAFVSAEQQQRREFPRDEIAEFVSPLFTAAAAHPPDSLEDLSRLYVTALRACIRAWADGSMDDAQARFLGFFVKRRLLPTTLSDLPELQALVATYRAVEAQIPAPRRTPGLLDGEPRDQPLFVRGNHKVPGDPVPRRFLESIDATPYPRKSQGRLRLAADFVREDNPFTARVAVNRIWHHLFGRGIVATPDNFGHLGEPPTHPALLDWLARDFIAKGWSVKDTIRQIVLSKTYRMDSRGSSHAAEIDPSNHMLSHSSVRRLDAESIRDALLALSGRLDLKMYGPPTNGGSSRRSVYVQVRRNALDPFLAAFDAPEPHTTRGRRDATNVPTQSLTMLNDPFVISQAQGWADSILRSASLGDDEQRIRKMFLHVFGRTPSDVELEKSATFFEEINGQSQALERAVARLEAEVANAHKDLSSLCEPVRAQLLEQQRRGNNGLPTGPTPIASWEFDDDARDALGSLHGELKGTARLESGALVLDGSGHVETARLTADLRTKTLEAWVQLSNLDQRGGGVMSVESVGGSTFDSIVFAEKDPRQWLPGSNHFSRTRSLRGPAETAAVEGPVHVAITHAADGTITAYRNGEVHGRPYRSDGPLTYRAGNSLVLFGLRHSPASGARRLRGRVMRARLYDHALSAEGVRASARGSGFVSRTQMLAAMTRTQRDEHDRLERLIRDAQAQHAAMGVPAGYRRNRQQAWRDFAHCLVNMKEFIYVR